MENTISPEDLHAMLSTKVTIGQTRWRRYWKKHTLNVLTFAMLLAATLFLGEFPFGKQVKWVVGAFTGLTVLSIIGAILMLIAPPKKTLDSYRLGKHLPPSVDNGLYLTLLLLLATNGQFWLFACWFLIAATDFQLRNKAVNLAKG